MPGQQLERAEVLGAELIRPSSCDPWGLAEKSRVARINGDGIDSIMYFRDKDNRVIAQYTYSQFRYKDKIYAIKMSELKILLVKCGYPEFTKHWPSLEKVEAAKKAVKSREKTANKLKRD